MWCLACSCDSWFHCAVTDPSLSLCLAQCLDFPSSSAPVGLSLPCAEGPCSILPLNRLGTTGMKSAVTMASSSDCSDGGEWRSYSPGSLTYSKEKLCLSRGNRPSFPACRDNPVLQCHREREVPARCRGVAAEVLQHIPGSIVCEAYVAETHKRRGWKIPGEQRGFSAWPLQKPAPSQGSSTGYSRRSYPGVRARCLQHPSTGRKVGQGLFAKLLGLVKRQIFVSCQKCRDVAKLLSPSGRSGALAYPPQLGKSIAQGGEGT